MPCPREVTSETQQFQSRLESTLPMAKSISGFLEREKKYTYDVTF